MVETDEITNTMDVIDSRDIESRIKYLEAELENEEELYEGEHGDIKDELDKLTKFKDDVDSSEWKYGIAFIRDDYFEDYAREFAEDIGAIGRDAQWPTNHIDWEAAADELRIDYADVDFDGITYWYR